MTVREAQTLQIIGKFPKFFNLNESKTSFGNFSNQTNLFNLSENPIEKWNRLTFNPIKSYKKENDEFISGKKKKISSKSNKHQVMKFFISKFQKAIKDISKFIVYSCFPRHYSRHKHRKGTHNKNTQNKKNRGKFHKNCHLIRRFNYLLFYLVSFFKGMK